MTSLVVSPPAGIVTWPEWPKVTFRVVPRAAFPPLAWTATSTALTSSGVSLYRLDRVMRASEPATLLWATIRMVWSWNAGPPVVMLGDQALTRSPLPWEVAAFAVPSGTATRAMAVNAPDSKAMRRGLARAFWWDIVGSLRGVTSGEGVPGRFIGSCSA
ncbi:hypothetical protein [Actinoallomurus acanthiterrae]